MPAALQPADLPTARWLVPHAELRRRAARLQELLRERGCACAVLSQTITVYHLTGSIANGWLLVPADAEPVLLVRRAAERTRAETCWDVREARSTKQLAAELTALGVSTDTLGVELDVTPAAEYLKLRDALPGAELVDVAHEVRTVRAVKSEWELTHVHAAAKQVRAAMEAVIAEVRAGWREIDAFLLAERTMREHGHQGPMRMRRFGGEMFFGQVCAGANAALPAWLDAPLGGTGLYPSVGKGASEYELADGDLLVLDLMGGQNGYMSDCTRVIAIGGRDAVDDDLLAAQEWCVDVLARVAARARPGVAASSLYDHALELVREAGHEARFMGVAPDQARFVGHGIGLEVDEYPFLAPRYDTPLEPGMVFALEPKLVFPGRAAVGIEDAFVVTESGAEPLEAVPRETFEPGGLA